MSKAQCSYCNDTGYIKQEGGEMILGQMCGYCEIGQAIITGYSVGMRIKFANYEEALAKNEQLQAKVVKLKANLRRYGRHLEVPPCQKGGAIRCSCDFDQALSDTPGVKED